MSPGLMSGRSRRRSGSSRGNLRSRGMQDSPTACMPAGHRQTPRRNCAGGAQTGGGGGVTQVRPRRTVPGVQTHAVAAAFGTKGAEQTTGLMQRPPRWIVPSGHPQPPSAFWIMGGRQTSLRTHMPLRRIMPRGQEHSPAALSVIGGLQA